jgi:hypothetical protein
MSLNQSPKLLQSFPWLGEPKESKKKIQKKFKNFSNLQAPLANSNSVANSAGPKNPIKIKLKLKLKLKQVSGSQPTTICCRFRSLAYKLQPTIGFCRQWGNFILLLFLLLFIIYYYFYYFFYKKKLPNPWLYGSTLNSSLRLNPRLRALGSI